MLSSRMSSSGSRSRKPSRLLTAGGGFAEVLSRLPEHGDNLVVARTRGKAQCRRAVVGLEGDFGPCLQEKLDHTRMPRGASPIQ